MASVSVVTSPLVFGGSSCFIAAVSSVVGSLLEFASGLFSASILFLILWLNGSVDHETNHLSRRSD